MRQPEDHNPPPSSSADEPQEEGGNVSTTTSSSPPPSSSSSASSNVNNNNNNNNNNNSNDKNSVSNPTAASGGDCFDVTEYCEQVVALLDRHFALVRGNTILPEKDRTEHERKNAEATLSFSKRQTKITFMGVMKAGKSSSINASCGQHVLPSRIQPMTTLSTTISHNGSLKKPRMTIPDEPHVVINRTMAMFRVLVDAPVATEEEGQNKEKEKEKEKVPDHIMAFLAELQKCNFSMPQDIEGIDEITAALTVLNDLVRMSCDIFVRRNISESLADDLLAVFNGMSAFPHIEVQFLTCTEVTETPNMGTLTLIDTPGPDEIRLSEVLQRVNRTILSDSDAICLVLNAKTAGNEAEASLFKTVQRLASNKLYVILNQVDDSNQEARDLAIKTCLRNIENFNNTLTAGSKPLELKEDHIFPMSARDALMCMMLNKYKSENPGCETLPPAKDAQWRNFYQVLWGSRWERSIVKNDFATLDEDCTFLYSHCGLDPYLKKVVHDALISASRKSTEATLIKIRNSALLMKKRTQTQVALLENSDDIRSTTNVLEKLQLIKDRMRELQLEGDQMQQLAYQKCLFDWAAVSSKARRELEMHVRGEQTGWVRITYFSKPVKKYFGDEKIVAPTLVDAFKKIQPALEDLKDHVCSLLRETLLDFVDGTYSRYLIDLAHQFNSKIVTTVVQTMSGEFKKYNIHHALPKIYHLPLDDIKAQLADLPLLPTSRTHKEKVGKTAWWWFFGLVGWEETKVNTVYELDPVELRAKVLDKISKMCAKLDVSVQTHIENATNSLFDPFFKSVTQALEDISSDLATVQSKLQQSQQEVDVYKQTAQHFYAQLEDLEKSLLEMHTKIGPQRGFIPSYYMIHDYKDEI